MARAEGRGARGARDESIGEEIDSLFQLPLGEFTRARNALAAKLKKEGASAQAEQVKSLTKPSISAWVTNQLYWREREAFDRLLATGEQIRTAQAAQLAGNSADTRAPLAARRAALSELAQHASAMLRDARHASSRDTMRRITMTLEALATYGESPGAPELGRLTADVDPPGFEALAALAPQSGDRALRRSTPAQVIAFTQPKPRLAPKKHEAKEGARREAAQRRAREAELRKALHDAEQALRDAKRDAKTAHDKLKNVVARAKEMEKRRAALEAQLEKAQADAGSAREETRRFASRAEEAARVRDDAERAVQRVREA
ncbi:MAG TPA: hypothetical protein VKE70_03905, partial [Candidatus Solibacter sp.]|nr:hypothetical protein [Candidatus Solibacter sp.]